MRRSSMSRFLPSVILMVGLVGLGGCAGQSAEALAAAQADIARLDAELVAVRERLAETEEKMTALEARLKVAEAKASRPPRTTAAEQRDARASAIMNVLKHAEAGDLRCPEIGRCTITRAFLQELMANPAQLATQARIIPGSERDSPRGFRIFGIRPDSLPKLLGFRNGDRIISINGSKLASVTEAMAIYEGLRETNNLVFEVERRDESLKITVEVVDVIEGSKKSE